MYIDVTCYILRHRDGCKKRFLIFFHAKRKIERSIIEGREEWRKNRMTINISINEFFSKSQLEEEEVKLFLDFIVLRGNGDGTL